MEDKQKNSQSQSAQPVQPEPQAQSPEQAASTSVTDPAPTQPTAPVDEASTQPTSEANEKGRGGMFTVIAVVIVVLMLAAVWFLRDGDTAPAPVSGIDPEQVVATVNGVDIVGADLATSISQITATAQLQGIDVTDPSVQSGIQSQAIELLINTEALEQEAESRAIEVTDADVTGRIDALVQEIGSEDALMERMTALGIDRDTLEADVKSELMIQALLDQEFAAADISVSDAEIADLYQATTGGSEEAPSLNEVRSQIETQIRVTKEQEVVDNLIAELRSEADIEIIE